MTDSQTGNAVTRAPRGLAIDGRVAPLFSGAMHYFRVPRRRWAACLHETRALGLRIVESYVPWGVHEEGPGRFRFTGDLDLGAFLDEAQAAGLHVILRPGPHINAELTGFGFPERVLRDPSMQARSGRDTVVLMPAPPRAFPVPSYSAPAFLDAVGQWYRAVAEVVVPRLFPRGPVIALQVDNEQGHFFRAGPFDSDYSEGALAAWREEEGERWGEPPRALAPDAALQQVAHVLAWLAFKERRMTVALAELGRRMDAAGLVGVPRFHNFPPVEPTLFDVPSAETAVDFAGIDLYHPRAHYRRVRRRALHLAGSSRLPYAPELAAGSFAWGPPFDENDTRALALNALMHGVAGFNYYMLVERDRWFGSPISVEGERRPILSDMIARLHAALDAVDWTSLERAADIGVLVPREYGRLALAGSHLGPVGPAFGEFLGFDDEHVVRDAPMGGLPHPVQREQLAWQGAIESALDRAHLPYVLCDASTPVERLLARKLLIVPTFDFLDEALDARLREFVARGGRLASGPRTPTLDAALQRHAFAALPGDRLDAALLEDAGALRAAITSFATAVGARRPAPARDAAVDTALHTRADGSPALLFVANRSADPITATVELDASAALEDVLDGARFQGAVIEVALPPHAVRMLRFT